MSSQNRPYRMWGPPSLLCSGYGWSFPFSGPKLTTDIHLTIPRPQDTRNAVIVIYVQAAFGNRAPVISPH